MIKCECLKIRKIGQSAAEVRTEQGSTTKQLTMRKPVQYGIQKKGYYYETNCYK